MKLSFASKNAPPPPPPLPDVVLASQSMGRKHLLEKLGIRFRQAVTRIDEEAIVDGKPETMLRRRAAAKAKEVADHPRVYGLAEDRPTLIIAADSMALIGKRTFGKSKDREDTKTMLKSLMGKTHVFATAVHILLLEETRVKKTWEKLVKTKVTMRRLTPVEGESYVSRFDFSRFAAGYSLNDAPWDLITKIEGSYTNVIGLPFEVLLPILRKLKIIM
ncbi:septum formation protein Maf [Candidatus Gottesmanbacteria bacterium]|nr:septum formation protein Maf [Candidatus Gottesmanbacteria bacterium]